MQDLEVTLIPALTDNYIYVVHDPAANVTAVVDPAEAEPVRTALEAAGRGLDMILVTHHHGDHVGGVAALKQAYGATVVGPGRDTKPIPAVDRTVGGGDSIDVGSRTVRVFDVPGHTKGHIAYWFETGDALFSGDSLFSLGCGRVFEGTMAQMWASLQTLRGLPDTTRVYCGHEYTKSNAAFARSVDPNNAALDERAAEVDSLRDAGKPTLPSLLGREKRTNPFLRADDPDLQARLDMAGQPAEAVFAELRRRKDRF